MSIRTEISGRTIFVRLKATIWCIVGVHLCDILHVLTASTRIWIWLSSGFRFDDSSTTMRRYRVMIPTRRSVFASSIFQEVNAIGFIDALRKELQHHTIRISDHRIQNNRGGWMRFTIHLTHIHKLNLSSNRNNVHRILWRVIEFTSLTKFAGSVLEIVLAYWFVGTAWE